LWLDAALPGDHADQHLLWTIDLHGPLSHEQVTRVLQGIVDREAALRTVFRFRETGLEAGTLDQIKVLLPLEPAGAGGDDVQSRLDGFGLIDFDLVRGPLFRFCLYRLAPERHVLACGFHHMVMDGESWGGFYRQFAMGLDGQALAPAPRSYADWSEEQRRVWSRPEACEAPLRFWKAVTQGVTASWTLPHAGKGDDPVSRSAVRLETQLGTETGRQLAELAGRLKQSPYRIALAAFGAYWLKLTGRNELPIGLALSGRDTPDLADRIGYFVQLGVVAMRGRSTDRFDDLVRRMGDQVRQARRHQAFPFALAVRAMRRNHQPGQMPFSPVSFIRMPDAPPCRAGALDLAQRRVFLPRADRDISVYMQIEPDRICLHWVARAACLDPAALERLAEGYQAALGRLLQDPSMRLRDLRVVPPAQLEQIAALGRGPDRPRSPGRRLDALIWSQAARTPDRVALVDGGTRLTYRQLVDAADGLAGRLLSAGLCAGGRVPLVLPRGAAAVVAELAVMRAGGVFVPIDPDWPVRRIEAVLATIQAEVGIADADAVIEPRPAACEAGMSWLSPHDGGTAMTGPARAEGAPASPDGAIYCIFTSGSTGAPKGALNTHDGVLNRFDAMTEAWGSPAQDIVLATAAPTTDTSVWLYFWPLTQGGTTVIAPLEAVADPKALTRLCRSRQVTLTDLVPSLLRGWVDQLAQTPEADRPTLRLLSVGGETMRVEDVAALQSALPQVVVYNTFGPTEASIGTLFHRIERPPEDPSPIGRPIANVQAVVLDPSGDPVPIGIPGELYLSGAALGLGYLARPDADAESFLRLDPFGTGPRRFYRTGDQAWMDAQGVFHFLGRLDHQVQVNGQRVELQEIEAVLHARPDIAQAGVVPVGDGARVTALAAFLEPRQPGCGLDLASIRAELINALPRPAVPGRLVPLDRMPMTSTGKIDRLALCRMLERLEPAEVVRRQGRAPASALEFRIAGVFSDILDIGPVHADDDFFLDLGGDSLSGLLAVLELERVLVPVMDVRPGLRDLLAHPSVRSLAETLEARSAGAVHWQEDPDAFGAVIRRQVRAVADWPGVPPQAGGLLRTPAGAEAVKHKAGKRLFWCCQDGRELQQLAAALAPGVCVTGMRSGHLVMDYHPELLAQLAARYAQEIEACQPEGALYLGGNCQGGRVALAVAQALQDRGRVVSRMLVVDLEEIGAAVCPITLVFGAASHVNPIARGQRLPDSWAKECPFGYAIESLPGAHGQYFKTGHVEKLAELLLDRVLNDPHQVLSAGGSAAVPPPPEPANRAARQGS
jgi:amino acid adenylation domain-containing protein